jgi:hypothetical protein
VAQGLAAFLKKVLEHSGRPQKTGRALAAESDVGENLKM